jgi:outer membrane protein TolC
MTRKTTTFAGIVSAAALIAAVAGAVTAPAPLSAAGAQVVHLTLAGAIARGLEYNLGVVTGAQRVREAEGARRVARAALLPQLSFGALQAREEISYEAYGLPVAPGTSPIVGPFDVSDVRVYLAQPLLDLSAAGAARAAARRRAAAQSTFADTREAVVYGVAELYLRAVTAGSRIAAAEAQLRTAQALFDRAADMKNAGTAPGIEVLRAQVELADERQRLIADENDLDKEKLALARAIGLPLDQPLELADAMPPGAPPEVSQADALAQAFDDRHDLKALNAEVEAAEAERAAARDQALPSLWAGADLGRIGSTLASAKSTFTLTATLRLPLFEGGRIKGALIQADARLAELRARLADLRRQVEYDVRAAFLDLGAAAERVRVNRDAVELANEQLAQAQDRFSAGVSDNLEVVQAQGAVATADDNYLSSLYACNVAKLALARAIGVAEERTGAFLEGSK